MERDFWEFSHIAKVKDVLDKWGSREKRRLSCNLKAWWICVPENRYDVKDLDHCSSNLDM